MNTFFSVNLYALSIEFFLLFHLCFLLLFGVILSTNKHLGYILLSSKSINFLFLQIVFSSIILIVKQVPIFMIIFSNLLVIDSCTFYSKLVILFFVLIWYFSTITYLQKEKINNFEYWILILLSLLAIFLVIQACDLLSIYSTLELQSLIFYILASFKRNSEFSTEAGLKYFLLGACSSAFLLFGFSLLYSFTGLTNLNDISNFFSDNKFMWDSNFLNLVFISLSLVIAAFCFKLAAAPFHIWLPDVYEGVPTSIMIFFATIPKIAIIIVLIRFFNLSCTDFDFFWSTILIFSIFSSSVIGTMGAFYQIKWKRFIAYSSISHLSFFFLVLVANNLESFQNLFIYLFIYLVTLFGFCSFFGNFYYFKYPNLIQIRFFSKLALISITNPLISSSLILIIFSMAGIPPLIGFFSKFFILFTAVKVKIFGSVLFVLIFNGIACFYYLRLIQLIIFTKLTNVFPVFITFDFLNSIIIGICSILLITLTLNLDFLFLIVRLLTFSLIKI